MVSCSDLSTVLWEKRNVHSSKMCGLVWGFFHTLEMISGNSVRLQKHLMIINRASSLGTWTGMWCSPDKGGRGFLCLLWIRHQNAL